MSEYFSIGVVLLICIWTWTNMSFIVNRTETVSVTSLYIYFLVYSVIGNIHFLLMNSSSLSLLFSYCLTLVIAFII